MILLRIAVIARETVYVDAYISDRTEHFKKKYYFIMLEFRVLEKILER